ncbi:PREDICTED: uncharacterized protein LOC109480645 [Branchiostoma belcheri]|uniref:Uncharacterized protein LOC109480645 n=1 Tax=Branchiostoma belcheri TaxID=7741 RepID=A0A6P4ZAN6_BRABE|nr:PREDICTED: uncharacterized protein LOC109480645 [Branchiostoma belcheri]
MTTRRISIAVVCILQIFTLDPTQANEDTRTSQSCDHLKRDGETEDGYYFIDPDGSGGLDPFQVYCDMSSDQQSGITVVHHDMEKRASVDGRRGPDTRVVNITYTASMEQIQALVSLSSGCEQYLSYDCFLSPIFSRPYRHAQYRQHVAWYSRQNRRMINWAGAEGQDGKCACGVTGTCDNGNKRCNCDNDDNQWRQDGGYIRDKEHLPVTRLVFGDSRDVLMYAEHGVYSIGALRCTGQAVDSVYPASCAEVKSRGVQDSGGSYIIDPDGPGTGVEPFTVTCHFNQTVITTVHHNREEMTHVDGHEHPMSYRVQVSYAASSRQIQALMAISDRCEQSIEYHCYGSAIFYPENEFTQKKQHAAWHSREGTRMHYWPGARGQAGKCACGVSGTCDNGNPRCNCDNNDAIWRKDAGTVTDKSLLPVTGLAFGDTSIKICFDEEENAVSLLDEQGFYVLSPLRCRGTDHLSKEPLEREDDGVKQDVPKKTENPAEEPPVHEGTGIKNKHRHLSNNKNNNQPIHPTIERTDVSDEHSGAENEDEQPLRDVPNQHVDVQQNQDDAVFGNTDGQHVNSELVHPIEEPPDRIDENTGNNEDEDQPIEILQSPAALGQDDSHRSEDVDSGQEAEHESPQWVKGGGLTDEDDPSASSQPLTLEVGIPVVLTLLAAGFVLAMKMPCKMRRLKSRKRNRSGDFTADMLEFPNVNKPRLLNSWSLYES